MTTPPAPLALAPPAHIKSTPESTPESKPKSTLRTLVVHPDDRSTDFLRGIYTPAAATANNNNNNNTTTTDGDDDGDESSAAVSSTSTSTEATDSSAVITVITGGVSQQELRALILAHDRIIMLGHGCAKGLFGLGLFKDCVSYIIDDSMVAVLQDKDCLFIWCYANMFVEKHHLPGFYTGMFISEVSEAVYCDLPDSDSISQLEVDTSNAVFVAAVAASLQHPHPLAAMGLLAHVQQAYGGALAASSAVAAYNSSRLRYRAAES